jgi:hypothetical protein
LGPLEAAIAVADAAPRPLVRGLACRQRRNVMGCLSCADPINQLAAAELHKGFGRD